MSIQKTQDDYKRVVERYRSLTFKMLSGCLLIDKEKAWLSKATKAFYGRFGRYPSVPSQYLLRTLANGNV